MIYPALAQATGLINLLCGIDSFPVSGISHDVTVHYLALRIQNRSRQQAGKIPAIRVRARSYPSGFFSSIV